MVIIFLIQTTLLILYWVKLVQIGLYNSSVSLSYIVVMKFINFKFQLLFAIYKKKMTNNLFFLVPLVCLKAVPRHQ